MKLRSSILLLVFCIGFAIVSSKSSKTQIELQAIDSSTEHLKKELSHKSTESVSPKSTYSSDRFDSRKKAHKSPVLTQTTSQLHKTSKRVENRNDSVLGDMIIGSILFFAGFPCLWFNEKGYAYTKTFLRKYLKQCLKAGSAEIDPNNEDKLICVNGDTVTQDLIVDSAFDVQVSNSIKLHRHCQMYQWVQERHSRRISNDQDEVYYTYKLEWKDSFQESRNYVEGYGHENNNGDWLYNEQELFANTVHYGAFKLTEIQKKQCVKSEDVLFTQSILETVAAKGNFQIAPNALSDQNQFQGQSGSPNAPPPPNPMDSNSAPSGYLPASNYNSVGQKALICQQGYLYFRRDVNRSNPGDFRVKFTKVPCGEITVIGKQSFGQLETFAPEEAQKVNKDLDSEDLESGGCCICCSAICKVCEVINAPISEINWVKEQKVKKKVIFQEKLANYELKTWLMRLCGFLCFMFGIYFMLSPVYTLMYWFPLVGRYLGPLGSFICGLIGFLIAIPLSILVISIAWLFYRKEIGIPLLCIALIVIGYFTYSYTKDYHGEQVQEGETTATDKKFI